MEPVFPKWSGQPSVIYYNYVQPPSVTVWAPRGLTAACMRAAGVQEELHAFQVRKINRQVVVWFCFVFTTVIMCPRPQWQPSLWCVHPGKGVGMGTRAKRKSHFLRRTSFVSMMCYSLGAYPWLKLDCCSFHSYNNPLFRGSGK